MMRLLVVLATLALASCAGPYHPEIESRVLQRPEPPLTAADQRALAPYTTSAYFR